jgi:hypothetical protein
VDGLSRRGWIVLVSVTIAVMLVFVGAASFALGSPSGRPAVRAVSSTSTDSPQSPHLDPGPTPLGLPPRASPTPTQAATVPSQPVGTLTTGDCLQTYRSKSSDSYPVVDCASPHIAQVLAHGELPQPLGATFPGDDALETQIGDLCQQHLDWDWVRVWNEDVQIDERYPDTATAWQSGDRSYYCFVYTYSRHELTGSAVTAG